LLRDMERYRQKIAAAASLFEGWLATITAPLPVGSVAPCLPTKARDRPRDDLWLHEIKHDGFRVIARKSGAQWAAKGTAAALVRAASSGWESAAASCSWPTAFTFTGQTALDTHTTAALRRCSSPSVNMILSGYAKVTLRARWSCSGSG
jgi:hypothetical protein